MEGKIPPQQNTWQLTINLWAAAGVVVTMVIGALVSGAFLGARTVNSDHFLLQSTADAVVEIKASYVDKDVYNANQASINTSLRDIKNSLTDISNRLNK